MNRAGVNSYYHYDGLGSTRQLTDSLGAVTVSYTYDSFGNVIASSGSITNTYGFTGEQQFGEAGGLVFLRARYYNPSIGRFISRDPILSPVQVRDNFFWPLPYLTGSKIHSYVYCSNNPVMFKDPFGESECADWKAAKDADEHKQLVCTTCCVEKAVEGVAQGGCAAANAWNTWTITCQITCFRTKGNHGPDLKTP
jgi:RHS repeat-associated protein